MLECVSLAQMIEVMVKVLVNLARGTIFDQKASEDTKTTHPHHLTGLKRVSPISRREPTVVIDPHILFPHLNVSSKCS